MNIPVDKFRDWLVNKNLKWRSIKEYTYYFNKFTTREPFYTQESINRFLSDKTSMNRVARGFLLNLKKFILVNYKELNISREMRMDISEIELPQLSGRVEQKLINPLTEEQILEIEKNIPHEKGRLQLLMSYYGGLRLGELLKIKVISFNWEEWKKDINNIGECRVHGKGEKEGIAFFPPDLMRRIAKFIRSGTYPSPSSYLFIKSKEDPKDLSVSNKAFPWRKVLRDAAIKAGIMKFDEEGGVIPETNVTPHKLRHSWGYHLKNVKKVDIRDIQEILRHSSISTTERYTQVDKSQTKEILSKDVFSLTAREEH
ncbi:MAG TPA: hypothetical protein ENI23_14600 [bacterium]|nr:hypothetical protein [bacterium]